MSLDSGLAVERTALARRRTALAALATAILMWREDQSWVAIVLLAASATLFEFASVRSRECLTVAGLLVVASILCVALS